MATIDISVNTSGGMRKLARVEAAVGDEIFSLFQTLGPNLRNQLRTRIPKKTGRARAAIFYRIEATKNEQIDLLVGGDLVAAPHLLYIEKPRVGGGPIERFGKEHGAGIVRSVENAVDSAVRKAGGNV